MFGLEVARVLNLAKMAAGREMATALNEARLALDQDRLAEFCRRNHIQRLALFGSVLRDDFRPDSDIDVLVEFEPGHALGLKFFALQTELAQILGRSVDLHTPAFLSKYFRDRVLGEAEDRYVAP